MNDEVKEDKMDEECRKTWREVSIMKTCMKIGGKGFPVLN
jgi:hypothetical protein